MRRKRLLLFAAALLLLAAVCLALALAPRPESVRVGPDWTPRRLRDELQKAGLVYEGKELGAGSLLLKPAGSALGWGDAEAAVAATPVGKPLPRGLVLVTVYPYRGNVAGTVEDGQLPLYPFFLRGHPDDLRAIAAAVR